MTITITSDDQNPISNLAADNSTVALKLVTSQTVTFTAAITDNVGIDSFHLVVLSIH